MRVPLLSLLLVACGGDDVAAPRDSGSSFDAGARDAGRDAAHDASSSDGGDAGDSGADAGRVGRCPDLLTPDSPLDCYRRCTRTDECVWVMGDCCCHCLASGRPEAISSRYAEDYAQRQAALCAAVDCAMAKCSEGVTCPDEQPPCYMGYCGGPRSDP